jgi:hypothetical protein
VVLSVVFLNNVNIKNCANTMKVNLSSCAFLLSLIRCSSQYMQLNIENDELCSLGKRKIKLDEGPRSGLRVGQTRLNDHDLDWIRSMKCRFKVVPSSSQEGIIAVIQHLIFRKNSTTDECIDYVQFTRKDGSSSQKFCGRFNAALYMDHNFVNPADPISSGTAFVDEKGELDVILYVSKEHLGADEEMDLSIVFTAYRHCSLVLKRNEMYRPCSNTRREFCIYSGFFSDSYINCPLPDCEDEQGCSKPEVIDRYYGNKVLIGAVSTVFIVFALFILCLWICKTYKIFCWAQNFANPSSTTPQGQSGEAVSLSPLSSRFSHYFFLLSFCSREL